jgi:predicted lipoprotein with Yx(FWY)xxD motif
MKWIGVLASLVAALIVAGCGAGSEQTSGAARPAAAAGTAAAASPAAAAQPELARSERRAAPGARVTVADSQFGRVVADRRGEALYLFDREKDGRSECYGTCAKVWPPLLTKGKPAALAGVEQRLLGTTKRADGRRQVTYAGQPLYYYVGDSPGVILCQDVFEFGGTWLVVEPSGAAVQ